MKSVLNYKDQDYQVGESESLHYYSDNYKVLGKVYENDFRIKDYNNNELSSPDPGISPSYNNQYESNDFFIFSNDSYVNHRKNWRFNSSTKYFFEGRGKKVKPFHRSHLNLFQLTIRKVEQLIHQSEYILTLEEDWDGNGAATIDKEIWETATSFLTEYVYFILKEYNYSLVLPEINPGRNNSIDLEWRTEKGRLLINFNNKNPLKAAFYGDRYNNEDCLKGAVDVKGAKAYLAIWMKNYL